MSESWFEDPGDETLIEMVQRTHNGDGTETIAWRPKVPTTPIFLRLRFDLLGAP